MLFCWLWGVAVLWEKVECHTAHNCSFSSPVVAPALPALTGFTFSHSQTVWLVLSTTSTW